MEFDRQTSMVASILTAGLIIDTKLKIEDLDDAVRIYEGLGRVYMQRSKDSGRRKEAGSADQPEDLEIISATLTAGYIVNTWHTENISEIMDRLEEFMELYNNAEILIPELPESKTFLGVAAAVIIAGLIVNTYNLEETPEESTFLFTQCMQKLAGL